MSTAPLTDETLQEAVDLVSRFGSVTAAAKATGIPRTTLQSRMEQAAVRSARPKGTMIELASPEAIPLADIEFVEGRRHMVIPDVQAKPGVPLDHLTWAGQYAVAKKPDVIVIIGDFWDMASLCSYDKGQRSFEGRRYSRDVMAGNMALDLFMAPIREEQAICADRGEPWNPELHITEGNHEFRIKTATQNHPELHGTISHKDFNYAAYGWQYHPFKEVLKVDGVRYSHYFVSGEMGRPVTSARALITKKHASCVMGHLQRYEVATDRDADGKVITGLFVGAYYQHDEGYLDPQINKATWRGVHILYGVQDGQFTANAISLAYLKNRFGGR